MNRHLIVSDTFMKKIIDKGEIIVLFQKKAEIIMLFQQCFLMNHFIE